MATQDSGIMNWLKYSGASASVTLNPFHWFWTPRISREHRDDWYGPNERTFTVSILFLTVRVWIDDGSW